MRDILTFLAALVIAVLTAALAVPPFVDWTAHRAAIDGAISRAVGMEVRSGGPLEIRLLPSPRLRMDRLTLGAARPDAVSLDAMFVKAEIALTPLMSGEIRFRDTRIGRAEVKLPAGAAGDWRLPRALLAEAERQRAFAFDDLSLRQLLVTTVEPATGRTDQVYAEEVRLVAGSLTGPARLDGLLGGERFELSIGEFGRDLAASVKIGAGGAGRPRLDVDGRIELLPGVGDTLTPRLAGQVRLAQAPARPPSPGSPVAFSAQAALVAEGRGATFESFALETGEGAPPLRLAGSGRYDLDPGRLAFTLAARRIDLPALRDGLGADPGARLGGLRPPPGLPVDLALRLDAAAIGGDEDLAAVALAGELTENGFRLDRLTAAAPGQGAIEARGEAAFGPATSAQVSLRVQARDGERFARFLDGLAPGAATRLLTADPLSAAAEISVAPPVLSARALRFAQGRTTVTGALRYTLPDAAARGRLDAQLAAQGLDLGRLAEGGLAFEAARRIDYGLSLEARAVTYGASRTGRIAGRIQTEGGALQVEALEIRDLAGAEADLAGRIAPDGTGRIEGRVKAPRAAPLLDVFGAATLGGTARLLPALVRDGALDAAVTVERAGGPASGLRTTLRGTLAGGPLDLSTLSGERLREVQASLSTDRAGAWFGSDDPALRRPGRFEFAASRDAAGRLSGSLKAEAAGLAAETLAPLLVGGDDDRIDGGSLRLATADLRPFAALAGPGIAPAAATPLALRLDLSRGERLGVRLDGTAGDVAIDARLTLGEGRELGGEARLSRLSLPWLASALAFHAPSPGAPGAAWPAARFGPPEGPGLTGRVTLAAARLDLGFGLAGEGASGTLRAGPDGFGLEGISFGLGGGRVSGTASLARQGGLASLIGEGRAERVPLALFLGAPLASGLLGGELRFGSSGESVAGLAANLGGAGSLRLDDLRIEGAGPAAVERAASRALASDDPLAGPRLRQILGEELARAPLVAAAGSGPVSLVGGSLRASPLRIEAEGGSWQGSAAIDLRTFALDVRGALQARDSPRRWTGPPPYATLGWEGAAARPARTLDPGPLVNGLASAVLQRELERIEVFELDAAERARVNARIEMDRARRAAAEEAARQARLREEAAERARIEAERQRQEAERAARAAAERAAAEAAQAPPARPPDIRPPPALEEVRPPGG